MSSNNIPLLEETVEMVNDWTCPLRHGPVKPTVDILLEIADDADITGSLYLCFHQNTFALIHRHCRLRLPHLMFLKGYTLTGFAERVFHIIKAIGTSLLSRLSYCTSRNRHRICGLEAQTVGKKRIYPFSHEKSDGAIEEIYRFSSGAARLVNKVCNHCLLYGAQNGRRIIDDHMVKLVIQGELL